MNARGWIVKIITQSHDTFPLPQESMSRRAYGRPRSLINVQVEDDRWPIRVISTVTALLQHRRGQVPSKAFVDVYQFLHREHRSKLCVNSAIDVSLRASTTTPR
jgi:hypothetical protein